MNTHPDNAELPTYRFKVIGFVEPKGTPDSNGTAELRELQGYNFKPADDPYPIEHPRWLKTVRLDPENIDSSQHEDSELYTSFPVFMIPEELQSIGMEFLIRYSRHGGFRGVAWAAYD